MNVNIYHLLQTPVTFKRALVALHNFSKVGAGGQIFCSQDFFQNHQVQSYSRIIDSIISE